MAQVCDCTVVPLYCVLRVYIVLQYHIYREITPSGVLHYKCTPVRMTLLFPLYSCYGVLVVVVQIAHLVCRVYLYLVDYRYSSRSTWYEHSVFVSVHSAW
jgi:hypothetical protein